MKIEFLNESRTEVLVTRGWFRKMQAVITWYTGKDSTDHSGWIYAANGERCEDWLSAALYEADTRERCTQLEARKRSAWQPVTGKFPKARLVERRS